MKKKGRTRCLPPSTSWPRTNLLTFSFTTVLAVLGIALSSNIGVENVNKFLYLIPYFLIIPFEGRIAYYRLIHARISAYLEMMIPQDRSLNIAGKKAPEKQTWFFIVIAFLNNFEMFFLSSATAIVFYCKYPYPTEGKLSQMDWLMLSLPLVLSVFVGVIIVYTFNYEKWKSRYRKEWEKHKDSSILIAY